MKQEKWDEFHKKLDDALDSEFGVDKLVPKEDPKQKALEEAAANLADPNICKTDNWIAGAKWQQERMYSEEEVISILYNFHKEDNSRVVFSLSGITKWFEQFKKK